MNEDIYALAQSIADITTSEVDLDSGMLYWYNPVPGVFDATAKREVREMPLEDFFVYFHPDDRERMRETLWESWRSGNPFKTQYRLLMADGQIRWREVYSTVRRGLRGRTQRLLGIAIDITAYKEIEAKLDTLAHHDNLTGLANRGFFYEHLQQTLHRAQRNDIHFALFFIDLDRFKEINDTLGHACGDALLREIATRLTHCVRKSDFIARLGGDEFAILTEGHHSDHELELFAQKILENLNYPLSLHCGVLTPNASIGITSLSPQDAASTKAETLVHQADIAMYRAKEKRGTYHFFTAELEKSLLDQKLQHNSFRHAIASDTLVLHFQPQIDLRTGAIVSAEALVRWPQSDAHLLPAQFLVMKDADTAVAMDEWVLKTVCQQLLTWRETAHTPVPVAINVSRHLLLQPDLVERTLALLEDLGLPARWLRFEVSENTLQADAARLTPVLRDLRQAGIRTDIDDFGTGYFSLSQLRDLPVDRFNLDASFIQGIGLDPQSETLLRAIVAMCQHLQIHTLAEGVETAAQRAFLQEIGCDEMQGFLVSPALPAHAFAQTYLSMQNVEPDGIDPV